ncbi:MAG TPA: agmatinase family protein [Ferruginibacter sp.]|nr:agmatinase [Chitinophagaceae bacterium]HML57927.1 agmatinase family protein [Ferruginibacter sp.]HRN91970.1 agmatinase family protein [Ferruginibacter sp.]HRO06859.1 agmatinase family protein [Ferruginibacter sp.]HRO96257.1 agmatinase family protein [Ferruginibacter sp.]
MADLTGFDPNSVGNPNNNIFGLPFTEEEARLVILPVPWEVTVSYNAGTARAPDHIFKASLQVDLYDPDAVDAWKQGYFMRQPDQKILTRSDYLRKEAELYIHYISQGDAVCDNKFMIKTLKDINAGSEILNDWVYNQTITLLRQNKLVAILGGDHSTPLGFMKACAEHFGSFGILQIDAHCDLRNAYEGFKYSHASVMYNALEEISQVEKLVQVGIRDFCDEELDYISESNGRVYTLFDQHIKVQSYEGVTWKQMTDAVIEQLPQQVYLSFDIDGLDPKLCPQTGTPVAGGLEVEQTLYLIRRVIQSGRRIIGFDLNEVGVSQNEWDENVGARLLYRLCNLLVASNS